MSQFESLVREECELEEQLEAVLECKSAYSEAGWLHLWRHKVRWLIGELRTVRAQRQQVHASWFWSRVIGGER